MWRVLFAFFLVRCLSVWRCAPAVLAGAVAIPATHMNCRLPHRATSGGQLSDGCEGTRSSGREGDRVAERRVHGGHGRGIGGRQWHHCIALRRLVLALIDATGVR